MTDTNLPSLWIKDPLAIFADGAGRGVVVRQGRIAERRPQNVSAE
jgi:8-oxoguanine deaminase